MQNLELKARLADLAAARTTAAALATDRLGVQHQVDTYFHCTEGRLKLREIDGYRAELIAYHRPDIQGWRMSDYQRVPVTEVATLKNVLVAALGIRCVVEKRREIFLMQHIRIHLDEVAGLGTFLEFETMLDSEAQVTAAQAQLAILARHFGLDGSDLVAGSYGEML